jgi:hypothetical protein
MAQCTPEWQFKKEYMYIQNKEKDEPRHWPYTFGKN